MLYDLSGSSSRSSWSSPCSPSVGSIASVTVLTQSVVGHHRARVARHQSIPTYYRRLVLAH